MNLLIVESPAKAKTINKYLGKDYKVLASYGHVRDLPSKSGSVLPDQDFALTYEVDKASQKHLKNIADAAKNAQKLILATDPDREGEAISWHIIEALKKSRKLPKNIVVERVVFNEITKSKITEAIANPREVDINLVNAQQARRVLDYLVGFTLSPILWKKLPGSRSAGRVQSVALRLLCEREGEIERFKSQEYWDIFCNFNSVAKEQFTAKLVTISDKKLDKFFIKDKEQATKLEQELKNRQYQITDLTSKVVKRRPQPPFTTSTLQQDAANKLGFSTKLTMQTAQKLYEGIDIFGDTKGLITYMRTDGVTISNQFINKIRDYVAGKFTQQYLPEKPHFYKTKVKNAQEAHEAIRPTDVSLDPEKIKDCLSDIQYKLYKLIWQRAVASQMSAQELLQSTIEIASQDKIYGLRASGSILQFKGFTAIYDGAQDKNMLILPKVSKNDPLDLLKINPKQHFTDPPPRYNEASLVKKLEEIGIGRPSTYASIITILLDREYAILEKKRFFPQERGMLVTAFLVNFFEKYFEYDFTATLEDGLDNVSNGKVAWKDFLGQFWQGFADISNKIGEKEASEIAGKITDSLESHYFKDEQGEIDRKCKECDNGILNLRIGRYGAFISCSNYPECKNTKQISDVKGEKHEDNILGNNELGQEIILKKGPYGYYIELLEGEKKLKRVSIPKFISIDEIDLNMAKKISTLPRNLGLHPENQQEILANNGKFGPYIQNNKKFYSIKAEDLFNIELEQALLAIKEGGKKASKGEIKKLGTYPDTGDEIKVMKGRYGPYLKVAKHNIAIAKNLDYEQLTLEQAIELIAKKLK